MNEIKAVFYDLDNTLYPQIMDVRQRAEYCIKEYLDGDLECIKEFWVNEWLDNGPNKSDIIDRVIQKFPSSVKKEEIMNSVKQAMAERRLTRIDEINVDEVAKDAASKIKAQKIKDRTNALNDEIIVKKVPFLRGKV